MSKSLLDRPEVLVEKSIRGDKIGDKSQRENGNPFRENRVGELTYTSIGNCQ
tara:strand:+ start:429 stop:584 length:156 start_codon:yes stop_codon:yes gene_type:complete